MDTQGKAKVALTFALYQGDALVRRDTIVQDIVKVGKDPRSHLRVDDDLASRMHAVIEVASPGDITPRRWQRSIGGTSRSSGRNMSIHSDFSRDCPDRPDRPDGRR